MALVHTHSMPCSKSELELFSVPPTQMAIDDSEYVEYRPFGGLNALGPIDFVIPGTGSKYIDINNTQLYLKVKITKADGSDCSASTADEKVAPINLLMHSMFSQIDVSLNGKLISDSTPTYPYRAMIETLLNYDMEAKDTHLQSQMYFKDTASHMDFHDLTATTISNVGLKARFDKTTGSKVFEMMGPIHADIFAQNNVLLPGVEVRLKLHRNKDAFCLTSKTTGADFKVHVLDAILYVRKLTCSDTHVLSDIAILNRVPAKYKIRRTVIRNITIPAGTQDLQRDNVFLGDLPKRVVLCLVETTAFNGDYKKNPFRFQGFDLNYLALHADEKQFPAVPLTPDFTNHMVLRSYLQLYAATGRLYADGGIDIAPNDFLDGYALFAFDLTPDGSHGQHYTVNKRGNLRLDLKFGTALTATTNLLIYAEFDNIIEIDRNRNIIYDFAN